MKKSLCVECQKKQRAENSALCGKCKQTMIKQSILNEDRVVESPHNSWF